MPSLLLTPTGTACIVSLGHARARASRYRARTPRRGSMHESLQDLIPPDAMMLGPRRLAAWCIIAMCLVALRFSVRLLPRESPVRIFIEGSTALMRGGADLRGWLSA